MAIKDSEDGRSWLSWEESVKIREKAVLDEYKKKLKEDIAFYQFQQYFFSKQWFKLKAYANSKKISIVGDIPIYVALDGVDAWGSPELFQFDQNCNPIKVAGCPPDAFSDLGQLWGNPVYNWEYHKKTNYEWWIKRLSYCYQLYDIVRIDHFRGFDAYYSIPYGMPDAKMGKWMPGPGYDLFRVVKNKLGQKPIIAEDLGFLTDSVRKLVEKTGYPGMKVLQFAFDSREERDYLPYNYDKNSVVYTGTHDNDTSNNWYLTLDRKDQEFAGKFLDIKKPSEASEKMVKAAMGSVSDTCIIPMQDFLNLGGEARMNIPSTLGTNWKWRMLPGQDSEALAIKIYELTTIYGRL